jgi:hypothetical protein
LIMALCLALLVGAATKHLPFFSDDGFISLRYAKRLIDGHGLTWTDGERVEGYSNLLWVLCCAILGALSGDFVAAARVLGGIATAAGFAAVLFAHPAHTLRSALPALAGASSLALALPVAVWAIGGLEQPLVLSLLLWALVLGYPLVSSARPSWRQIAPSALLLGCLCWTRLDAPVLVVGVCAGLALARGGKLESFWLSARLLLVPAGFVALQTLFRGLYYGDLIPNTARAKVALTSQRFDSGLNYLSEATLPLLGVVLPSVLAVVAAAALREHRRRCVFLVAPLVSWCAYLAVVGGDIFPARRQLLPALAIMALLIAIGFELAVLRLGRATALRWLVVSCALHYACTNADPENQRVASERWEWPGEPLGNLLKQAFGSQRPLLAVDASGSLPFYSELPSLDMLGLNDRHLARHRARLVGRGLMGHELGDGNYVLRREPDLIVFGIPSSDASPRFKGGFELLGMPKFHEAYRTVTFEAEVQTRRGSTQPRGSTVTSSIYVKKAGKIGVRASDRRLFVPGFLIGGREHIARVDSLGRLGLAITPEKPVNYGDAELSPGFWRLEILGSGALLKSTILGLPELEVNGNGHVHFQVPGDRPRKIMVNIAVPSGAAHIVSLEFSKTDQVPKARVGRNEPR